MVGFCHFSRWCYLLILCAFLSGVESRDLRLVIRVIFERDGVFFVNGVGGVMFASLPLNPGRLVGKSAAGG